MLLADAMALQFSRPLFMIPLAMILLAELPGWHRTAVTMIGFLGILLYARPFTEGFDTSAVVGAVGAFFGGVVVVCVKRLSATEPTRTIMFYYAFWTTVFAILPAAWVWVTPTWTELVLLIAIGLLGISGQACITHGLAQGEATALVPLDYSRILYSAILGYLLFAEIPGPLSIAGMALIVASSLYLVVTKKRRK
jgi:drug/metabolite transporter (DMT)-like permease